jgi:hypothetical protein
MRKLGISFVLGLVAVVQLVLKSGVKFAAGSDMGWH